jgi:hypothetical protein
MVEHRKVLNRYRKILYLKADISLVEIYNLSEASEALSLASGSRGSDQGQNEKVKITNNLKSTT